MLKVAIKVFDRELSGKGRDLPELKMHKSPKQRAPRESAQTHKLPEAKYKQVINQEEEKDLRKTVLKKSAREGSRDVVLESWVRKTKVGPPSIHEIQLIDEISVSPNGDERHYYLVETYPDMFTASSFPTRSEAKAYVNALKDRGGNEGQFVRVTTAATHVSIPNPAQDPLEEDDMLQREQSMSDLDTWLAQMGEGKRDSEDDWSY